MAVKAYGLISAFMTAGLVASVAHSGAMGDAGTAFSYRPHVALQVGSVWTSQGKNQHINMSEMYGDDFSVTRSSDVNVLAGLGLYWDAYKNQYATFSFGVNAFYLANTSVQGEVTQEGLFTNLGYKYSVTNWPIYFGARATTDSLFSLTDKAGLTMDVGIGPNIIHANGFREYSLFGDIAAPDHPFSSHTTTAFSAMAGAGVKLNSSLMGYSLPLECGYRFYYLGNGNFNQAIPQVIDKLNTGHSYANALVCSVTV